MDRSKYSARAGSFGPVVPFDYDAEVELRAARTYIDTTAEKLDGSVQKTVRTGNVIKNLTRVIEDYSVSHVVMAGHGRTGLSRVVLGGTTDNLIQHFHQPVIVIPALACEKVTTFAPQASPLTAALIP